MTRVERLEKKLNKKCEKARCNLVTLENKCAEFHDLVKLWRNKIYNEDSIREEVVDVWDSQAEFTLDEVFEIGYEVFLDSEELSSLRKRDKLTPAQASRITELEFCVEGGDK